MQEFSRKKRVSPDFRQLLLELTEEFLIESPEDFVAFAVDFLTRKQVNRISKFKSNEEIILSSEVSEIEFEPDNVEYRTNIFQGSSDLQDELTEEITMKESTVRCQLKEEMQKILIFNSLQEDDLNHLVDLMRRRDVEMGEIIINEGELGDFFYVVGEGVFIAYKTKENVKIVLKTYEHSGYFGELALMYDMPRSCSVKAESDGVLWCLDRARFRNTVVKAASDRRRQYLEFLDRVPMLGKLSVEEKLDLADCLECQVYPPSSRVIKEGDQANGMHFVIRGSARVAVKRAGRISELEVKRINEGEYFGELALVTHKPRAASVYAITELHTAFLDVQCFERLLGPCIEVMKRNIAGYREDIENALDL